MAGLQNVDELFPAQPQSVDELFPADVERDRYRRQTLGTSPIQDLIFGDTSVNPIARILDHFGQGAKQGWGAEPNGISQESVDALKKLGIFNDYDKGQRSIIKAANESLFRSAATYIADPIMRGMPAAFRGTQEAIAQVGQEASGTPLDVGLKAIRLDGTEKLGREAAGAFEAFPTGVRAPTGIPHAPVKYLQAEARAGVPAERVMAADQVRQTENVGAAETNILMAEIERARDLGVIGAGEAGWKGTAEVPASTVKQEVAAVAPDVKAAEPVKRSEAAQPGLEAAPETAIPAPAESVGAPVDASHPIAQDVARRLEHAGRPADEAAAAGQVVASHYEARSARFGGELGTAEEMYKREGAEIRGPNGRPAPVEAAPEKAAAVAPVTAEAPPTDEAQFRWDQFLAGKQASRQGPTIQTGYNATTSKSGAQLRARAGQVWEPGNIVDVGFVKNLLIAGKNEDGSFSLISRPDKKGQSKSYEVKPHEGLGKGQFVDFLDAVKNLETPAAKLKIAAPPQPKIVLPGEGAAPERANQSLLDFLAREGGLKPTADLKQIFGDQNPTIPGAGKLFRKDGMSMDQALTKAKESSYILDPNDIQHAPGVENAGANTVRWHDLQDMIAEEAAGKKQYRNTRSAEPIKVNVDEEYRHIADQLASEVEASGGSAHDIDPVTERRVVEMVQKGEAPDVMSAYERAIMEDEYFQSKRPYENVPDALMGFRRNGQNKGFDESNYRHVQPVKVTLSGGDEFHDAIKGLNQEHALERAWRNWPDATNIEPSEVSFDQIKRGKIRFPEGGKPIITLFKDANASTFIHETGHHWLEELMKDSEHPKAPEGLRTDADAVLKWLGVETYHDIKVRHHEQFARGFERYMMEGKAPTQGLARVFEKFKNWLTRIYQTVDRLKSPVNDEIRGVFDRLIALKPEQVKIEPEGPAKTFADIHEADAISTPAAAAHPVAETIQAERDRLATEHIPEEHDARLEGVTSEAGRREAGGPQPVRDGNEAPRPEEAGNDQASGAVGEGGSVVAPESAGPSAQPRTEVPVSAQESFKPETPLIDKAGNIRLDNLGTNEDVNQAIRDAAVANNDFIDARRGVVTDGQVLELADALGMDAGQLNQRKLGQAFNAEQIMAARKLLIQSATSVRDAMVKAATGSEADIMAYAEAKTRHQMIQEQVAGLTAEAGRALRAFRKLEGQQEAGQIDAFLKDATGKTLFQLQREAQLGMQLETPAQVSKFVNDSSKPTWREMAIEAWITALLSGPKTHMANIVGNTISGLWRPLETATAAGVGKVRNLVTGTQDRVLPGEAAAELFGMVRGSKEGIVAAYKAFKSEEPQLTNVRQVEQGHPKALPSATVKLFGREMEIGGKQARIPLRLLGAEDEMFKAIAFRGDINRQSYALAAKEGLPAEQFHARVAELSMNPTEEMVGKAKDVAEYQTFQTPLGKVGRSVQNFANSHILAKLVVPFVRTPINLLKYAGERTPLGVFSREVRDNLSGKNGAVARDTQIARITLGTMVGIAAFEMASQGLITGGGPADRAKKSIMQADGWQDYSIKIGDMYYRYNRLDPFSVILGVAADAYEVAHASGSDHPDKEHLPALIFAAISKNILNRASLSGMSDLIQATADPERYGKNYVKGMVGTVIPAISNQTAQTLDPTVREARTVLDTLKARIPGLSSTLHPRRDVWGEPIVREGGLGPDIASPIMEARLKNDPVNKALIGANYFPGKLDRKIRGVDLTDQQYDDYSRVAGRTAKVRLNAIVGMPGFDQMPESTRKELMTNTITASREMARSLIMMQNPDIIKKANDAKRANLH